jgi:hypothetical protein
VILFRSENRTIAELKYHWTTKRGVDAATGRNWNTLQR